MFNYLELEGKCKECGKVFFLADSTQWVFKLKDRANVNYFCSWKCLQKARESRKTRHYQSVKTL